MSELTLEEVVSVAKQVHPILRWTASTEVTTSVDRSANPELRLEASSPEGARRWISLPCTIEEAGVKHAAEQVAYQFGWRLKSEA